MGNRPQGLSLMRLEYGVGPKPGSGGAWPYVEDYERNSSCSGDEAIQREMKPGIVGQTVLVLVLGPKARFHYSAICHMQYFNVHYVALWLA